MALTPSSVGIFSAWFRLDDDVEPLRFLLSMENVYIPPIVTLFDVYFSSGMYRVELNTSNTISEGFTVQTLSTFSAATSNDFTHLLCSWDMSGPSKIIQLYINDVIETDVIVDDGTTVVFPWDNIHIIRVLADSEIVNTNTSWAGCCSSLYLNTQEYLDFSIVSNRRKFIDNVGDMVDLGSTGTIPTGNQPSYYFVGDATDFPLNRGSEQSFSLIGSLVDCPPFDADLSVFTEDGDGYLVYTL